MSSLIIIVLALCFFMMLIYSITITCPVNNNSIDNDIESWVDYKELPYGNIRSGAGFTMLNTNANANNQIKFYEYPIYRRPLNWPVCHLVDYPQQHCRSDSL